MKPAARKKLAGWLTALFLFAVLMGAGPGMTLANKPEAWLGLPALYVWGLLCFFIQAGVVLTAFFFVWRDDDQESCDQKISTR